MLPNTARVGKIGVQRLNKRSPITHPIGVRPLPPCEGADAWAQGPPFVTHSARQLLLSGVATTKVQATGTLWWLKAVATLPDHPTGSLSRFPLGPLPSLPRSRGPPNVAVPVGEAVRRILEPGPPDLPSSAPHTLSTDPVFSGI